MTKTRFDTELEPHFKSGDLVMVYPAGIWTTDAIHGCVKAIVVKHECTYPKMIAASPGKGPYSHQYLIMVSDSDIHKFRNATRITWSNNNLQMAFGRNMRPLNE